MYELKEMTHSAEDNARMLKVNGRSHINYKMYTSMQKALDFALTGTIILSDGSVWNDMEDREQMQNKKIFAKCMSFSTRENVANWMLYGDQLGKNGAMINLKKAAIDEILNTSTVSIAEVYSNKIEEKRVLSKNDNEFEIFMTDIVYCDENKTKDSVSITYYDKSRDLKCHLFENRDIFKKKYEWAYEKETRLVVRPFEEASKYIEELKKKAEPKEEKTEEEKTKEEKPYIAIIVNVSKKNRNDASRIVHSPVFKGGVFYGKPSELTGNVDWNL